MNLDTIRIYLHFNLRRIVLLFYIFLSVAIIFSQFSDIPIFFFKNQIQDYGTNRNNKIIQKMSAANLPLFPIDLVYTWVDGRDPNWLQQFHKASQEQNITINEDDFNNRFVDNDELRYSLRSVEKNLPWIRHIFIVTWNNQRPDWINLKHPKLKFISHSEIFPKSIKLPTFNSKSIDFLLYKIPGLSEHFIYSNDDMYFGRPLKFTDFFTIEGKPIIYSKPNSWGLLHRRYEKFKENYNKNKDDGFLFMASLLHTVIKFESKFNKTMKYEYSHIPISLTKEIYEDVYSNFKDDIDHTISNRFRTQNDFQMQTIMIQYSLFANKSIVALNATDDMTFIIASPKNNGFQHLPDILYNLPKFISINIDNMKFREKTKAFIDFIFNKPSSFELKEKPPVVDKQLSEFWLRKNYSSFTEKYLF